jgi:DNA polymerase-3 subunit gamma/tau
MGHIALYRKYRPKNFDDITGQTAIVKTLRNEVISDKIANAYLFCGPRGTGKTSIARIFARAINCPNQVNGNPCNNCISCNDNNIDITEIDAASNNSVDNIRQIVEESGYACQSGRYRIYIIDEVHMLTGSSFNALLKTLEEPSVNTIFILATTEKHKVPQTIASRCQTFNFSMISETDMVNRLKYICQQEGITYESDNELKLISKLSEGALRDAVSILDQCAFMGSNHLVLSDMNNLLGQVSDEICEEINSYIENDNIKALMEKVDELVIEGKSMSVFADEMYNYYKNKIFNDSDHFEKYHRFMRIFAELKETAKNSSVGKTMAEISLIKICRPETETDYESVVQRLEKLEEERYLNKTNNIQINDSDTSKSECVKMDSQIIRLFDCSSYDNLITMVM